MGGHHQDKETLPWGCLSCLHHWPCLLSLATCSRQHRCNNRPGRLGDHQGVQGDPRYLNHTHHLPPTLPGQQGGWQPYSHPHLLACWSLLASLACPCSEPSLPCPLCRPSLCWSAGHCSQRGWINHRTTPLAGQIWKNSGGQPCRLALSLVLHWPPLSPEPGLHPQLGP